MGGARRVEIVDEPFDAACERVPPVVMAAIDAVQDWERLHNRDAGPGVIAKLAPHLSAEWRGFVLDVLEGRA